MEDPVRKVTSQMEVSAIKRGRGRPKAILREIIEKELALDGFTEILVFDKVHWYWLIHVSDSC